VKVLETDLERGYFTNHGLHLNSSGKEYIARKLARAVRSFLEIEKASPISLNWKDDTSLSDQNGNNSHTSKFITPPPPHLPTSSKQSPGRESQDSVASPSKQNEDEATNVQPQLTKRQRNKPTPRSQDFYGQHSSYTCSKPVYQSQQGRKFKNQARSW